MAIPEGVHPGNMLEYGIPIPDRDSPGGGPDCHDLAMDIFQIASRHARQTAWYVAVVSFSLLYGGDTIMAGGDTPSFAMAVGYFFMAVATWGVAAAVVYYGWLLYTGALPVPAIYERIFNVEADDQSTASAPVERDLPQGQPIRAKPSPAPGDDKPVRVQAMGIGASPQIRADGNVLGDYPDVLERLVVFLADRHGTVFSGRTMHDAGVANRDVRVMPNTGVIIRELEQKGYARTIGNSQYVLTDEGELWVEEQLEEVTNE